MKAIIAKDNKFNTIGIEVTSNDGKDTVFSWGIYPDASFNFIKEINVNTYESDIFKLVELKTELRHLENFVSRFFSIGLESKAFKKSQDGKGTVAVNFKEIDDEISTKKRIMAEMIQKFI